MALIGSWGDWQALIQRNEEPRVGLKPDHIAYIERVLAEAAPDALVVEVDAALSALRQVSGRIPDDARDRISFRTFSVSIADCDESWWLHRARELGLMSIVPIEPWPRDPEHFYRPPGYLHSYGTPNPELTAWMHQFIEEQKCLGRGVKRASDGGESDDPTPTE